MYLKLTHEESTALARYAHRERRTPRDQAAMMIRQVLLTIGELTPDGAVKHDPMYDRDEIADS